MAESYPDKENFNCLLADVRDKDKLLRVLQGVDIVFHTAAFKHVLLCESTPFEAVQTNIIGVQNIILASQENKVGRVVFTSSDKAVNPTNVMGTSKLMGERLISAANNITTDRQTVLSSVRFGNVMGSRGSVIPLFDKQIKKGGPVTVTHPEMTRFIMSIDDAVRLVIDAGCITCGGEVFVTKMKVIDIKELAEVMIEEIAPKYDFKVDDIQIKIIGTKPGEKMYEELLNSEEVRRTWELENYFVIMPAFGTKKNGITYSYKNIIAENIIQPYNSSIEEKISKEELRNILYLNKLI